MTCLSNNVSIGVNQTTAQQTIRGFDRHHSSCLSVCNVLCFTDVESIADKINRIRGETCADVLPFVCVSLMWLSDLFGLCSMSSIRSHTSHRLSYLYTCHFLFRLLTPSLLPSSLSLACCLVLPLSFHCAFLAHVLSLTSSLAPLTMICLVVVSSLRCSDAQTTAYSHSHIRIRTIQQSPRVGSAQKSCHPAIIKLTLMLSSS